MVLLKNKLVLSEKTKISKLLDYDQLPGTVRCIKKDLTNSNRITNGQSMGINPSAGLPVNSNSTTPGPNTKINLADSLPANFLISQRQSVKKHPLSSDLECNTKNQVMSGDLQSDTKKHVNFDHMSLEYLTQRNM